MTAPDPTLVQHSSESLIIILLVIFVVDIRKASLLRIAHHSVTSPDHQTVGYVHWVVTGSFQDKSENSSNTHPGNILGLNITLKH